MNNVLPYLIGGALIGTAYVMYAKSKDKNTVIEPQTDAPNSEANTDVSTPQADAPSAEVFVPVPLPEKEAEKAPTDITPIATAFQPIVITPQITTDFVNIKTINITQTDKAAVVVMVGNKSLFYGTITILLSKISDTLITGSSSIDIEIEEETFENVGVKLDWNPQAKTVNATVNGKTTQYTYTQVSGLGYLFI